MATFRIRFVPDGREASVDGSATLLDAARAAGVYVGAVCGGDGTCGKCRLIVRAGTVDADETGHLDAGQRRAGYVLACRTRPRGDLLVEVPPESRLSGYRDVESSSERFRDFTPSSAACPVAEIDPVVSAVRLAVREPSLDDAAGDRERVLDAIRGALPQGRARGLDMPLDVVRALPRQLRSLEVARSSWTWRWDGRVTAAVASREGADEVLFVEPGGARSASLGLAVDVGTTTVVAHLVDLATGATLEAAAKYNAQVALGADVITRINAARAGGGANALHAAVIGDINTLVADLVRRTGARPGDIHCVVAAGNTVMLHFLLGLEADLIRISPFVPAATSCAPVDAARLGIGVHPRAPVYTVPMIGSYVGGDITAGILSSGIHEADVPTLLLDIGTNGEIVLGSREFLVACAASAGPAFEGGQITCGMRATSGAIDSVRIGPDGAVAITTIDGAPPVGMCGTGLVDALAAMLLAGIVDRGGNLQAARAPGRVRTSAADGRMEFVVARGGDAAAGRDVAITETDIANLIRTKGAIYAAADALVQSVGLTFADVPNVYIAGAFGSHLDAASCIAIGLLPDVPAERIRYVGNSSVAGAKMAMLSRGAMETARRIARSVTYRELMVDGAYMEKFTSACFLPHTDTSRFPTVEARLREAGQRRARGGGRP